MGTKGLGNVLMGNRRRGGPMTAPSPSSVMVVLGYRRQLATAALGRRGWRRKSIFPRHSLAASPADLQAPTVSARCNQRCN